MKKLEILRSLLIVKAVLFLSVFFVVPMDVVAKSKVVAIDGMNYKVNSSMTDNLKLFVGKKVSVTIVTGKTVIGVVKEVGNHLIHMEKLDGKEYFDALIRIENISVIESAFREYQR